MTAEAIDPMDPILAHRGPWTEEDYLALPEDSTQRIELIDGGLLVSPRGDGRHQNITFRFCRELDRMLPDNLARMTEPNVRLRAGRLVAPDVMVSRDLSESLVYEAADVLLVVEVVSPTRGSVVRDRVLKPTIYAEAGIRWYLRIEQEPELELILHRLAGGAYVEHAQAGHGERLELPELACAIEVDALLRNRG